MNLAILLMISIASFVLFLMTSHFGDSWKTRRDTTQPRKPMKLKIPRTIKASWLTNLRKRHMVQRKETSMAKTKVLANAPYLLSLDSKHIYRHMEYLPLAAPLMRYPNAFIQLFCP